MAYSWRRCLEGDLRKRAELLLASVVSDLCDRMDEGAAVAWSRGDWAGVALLFAELGDRRRTQLAVERCLQMLAGGPISPWWHEGMAGIASAVAASAVSVGMDVEEGLSIIDRVLLRYVTEEDVQSCELMYGLAGIALYLLERMPRAEAGAGLMRVLDLLERRSVRVRLGRTWRASTVVGEPGCAVGMAHGVAGIVAVLAAVAGAGGAAGARAGSLLGPAVAWLAAQRRIRSASAFPRVVSPSGRSRRAGQRLSWCWGDLGVSIALLSAARALKKRTLEQVSMEVAFAAATFRPAPGKRVSLCHGAAGDAHLFNRLFQATGREEYRAAAEFWFAALLSQGGVGLRAPGLLSGRSGVALSVLSAISNRMPRWDRGLGSTF